MLVEADQHRRAVVELLLRTPRGQSVESHLSAEMLAPELLDLECLSALGRLERAGQVSTDVADAAARGLSSLPVQRLSHLALADRAWSCRGSLRLADAFYVAAAAKSGVARLTEAMAEEFKDRGLTVNAVLPSILDTPANRADMPKADPSRWVSLEALARVVLFLLSDDAAPINGALIPVKGRV